MIRTNPATPVVLVSIGGQYITDMQRVYVEDLVLTEKLGDVLSGTLTLVDKDFESVDKHVIIPMFADPLSENREMSITFGWAYWDRTVEWLRGTWRKVFPRRFEVNISDVYKVSIEFFGLYDRASVQGVRKNLKGTPKKIFEELASLVGYQVEFREPPQETQEEIVWATEGRSVDKEIEAILSKGLLKPASGKGFYILTVDDTQKKLILDVYSKEKIAKAKPERVYVYRGGKDVLSINIQTDFVYLNFGAGGVKETRIDLLNKTYTERDINYINKANIPMDANKANRFVRTYDNSALANRLYEGYKGQIVKLELTVVGDPQIKPGAVVEVKIPTAKGTLHWLSGKYMVFECTHAITSGGYQTTMQLMTFPEESGS